MRRRRGWIILLFVLWGVDGLPAVEATAPDGLPAPMRTSGRTFVIPFRAPKGTSPGSEPRRVLLNVSKDLGVTWEEAGEAPPSAGSFTYRGDVDGEYWFRLRTIDSEGRMRGSIGPDMRVLVNAGGPRLAGRAWKGENGEIVCRFAAVDDSIDLGRIVVEWRSTEEPQWQAIAASPVLSRESPAHVLGEEFWWAGDRTVGLIVRVSVHDSAGNRSVKQFPLEPADPGVDQAALAAEIGAPALPSSSSTGPALPSAIASGDGFPPVESIVAHDTSAPKGGTSSAFAQTGESRRPADGTLFRAASTRSVDVSARQPLATELGLGLGTASSYRGRPLHLSRSRSFAWNYTLPPGATQSRVELWGTRDGGVTWQRFAEDADCKSPIDVHLQEAALYGFRLEIGPADAPFGLTPRSGESPDCWLGVDEEAPVVKLNRADAEKTGDGLAVQIDYESSDPLLVPSGARLSYGPSPVGPWVTIADGLEGTGSYRWTPDRSVPAEVHLRVESRDAAGNVGLANTPGPVLLSVERKTGSLETILPIPDDVRLERASEQP